MHELLDLPDTNIVGFQLSDTLTEIVGKLGHWEIPMADESLGPTERDLLAQADADDQRGDYGH